MSVEIKHAATEIATHPKATLLTTAIANIATVYVEWVSPVVAALTSIGSFVIVFLLIRYHLKKNKKLDQDFELDKLRIQEIESKKEAPNEK